MQSTQPVTNTTKLSPWQQSLNENEEIVRKKRLRLGSTVTTEHGTGNVVGWDHPYRFIVQITSPLPEHREMVARFKDGKLCYFPKELTVC